MKLEIEIWENLLKYHKELHAGHISMKDIIVFEALRIIIKLLWENR